MRSAAWKPARRRASGHRGRAAVTSSAVAPSRGRAVVQLALVLPAPRSFCNVGTRCWGVSVALPAQVALQIRCTVAPTGRAGTQESLCCGAFPGAVLEVNWIHLTGISVQKMCLKAM